MDIPITESINDYEIKYNILIHDDARRDIAHSVHDVPINKKCIHNNITRYCSKHIL